MSDPPDLAALRIRADIVSAVHCGKPDGGCDRVSASSVGRQAKVLRLLECVHIHSRQFAPDRQLVAPDGLTPAALSVIVAATSVVGLVLLFWRQDLTSMPARAMSVVGGKS